MLCQAVQRFLDGGVLFCDWFCEIVLECACPIGRSRAFPIPEARAVIVGGDAIECVCRADVYARI